MSGTLHPPYAVVRSFLVLPNKLRRTLQPLVNTGSFVFLCVLLCLVGSFGIIMYEVLCEKMPFEGVSPIQVLQKVASDTLVLSLDEDSLLNLENSVLETYQKCLSKDPKNRPKFEEIFF